jgi:hypothetical protein
MKCCHINRLAILQGPDAVIPPAPSCLCPLADKIKGLTFPQIKYLCDSGDLRVVTYKRLSPKGRLIQNIHRVSVEEGPGSMACFSVTIRTVPQNLRGNLVLGPEPMMDMGKCDRCPHPGCTSCESTASFELKYGAQRAP